MNNFEERFKENPFEFAEELESFLADHSGELAGFMEVPDDLPSAVSLPNLENLLEMREEKFESIGSVTMAANRYADNNVTDDGVVLSICYFESKDQYVMNPDEGLPGGELEITASDLHRIDKIYRDFVEQQNQIFEDRDGLDNTIE